MKSTYANPIAVSAFAAMLALMLVCSSPDLSRIAPGQVRLGEITEPGEEHIYTLKPGSSGISVHVSLWGHQYEQPQTTPHLKRPQLVIEQQQNKTALWEPFAQARAPFDGAATARCLNLRLTESHAYRIRVQGVSDTGRYALIVNDALPGFTLDLEELNLGGPADDPYLMSSAYAVADESCEDGERIYAGTEQGLILESESGGLEWRTIYPPSGGTPMEGPVYNLFRDSRGTLYASPWMSGWHVNRHGGRGYLIESRDGGDTWMKAIEFLCPTGVGWRMIEDRRGSVFVGEYSANPRLDDPPPQFGAIWRREAGGEFEVVYRNPGDGADTIFNHVHLLAEDPYTGDLYAAIGDGAVGRALRSRKGGDAGSWHTLQRGVDAQYTSIAFTPDVVLWGQDTNQPHKKLIRWRRDADAIKGDEPFVTSLMMEGRSDRPLRGKDKGNWFWSRSDPADGLILFMYIPYGMYDSSTGMMQSPRLFASADDGLTWRLAITFPPAPCRENEAFGFWGPKNASPASPNGWIYAVRAAGDGAIHRGFRFRFRPKT